MRVDTKSDFEKLSAVISAADAKVDRLRNMDHECGFLTAQLACLKIVNQSESLSEAARRIRQLEMTQ